MLKNLLANMVRETNHHYEDLKENKYLNLAHWYIRFIFKLLKTLLKYNFLLGILFKIIQVYQN